MCQSGLQLTHSILGLFGLAETLQIILFHALRRAHVLSKPCVPVGLPWGPSCVVRDDHLVCSLSPVSSGGKLSMQGLLLPWQLNFFKGLFWRILLNSSWKLEQGLSSTVCWCKGGPCEKSCRFVELDFPIQKEGWFPCLNTVVYLVACRSIFYNGFYWIRLTRLYHQSVRWENNCVQE